MFPAYNKIRTFSTSLARQYPAVVLLLTVILSILPFLLHWRWVSLPVIVWLILTPFLFPWRNCCLSALVSLIAYLSAFFVVQMPSGNFFEGKFVNSTAQGEFLVTVDDSTVSCLLEGGRPRLIHCHLDGFRFVGEEQWQNGEGVTIGLSLPGMKKNDGMDSDEKREGEKSNSSLPFPAIGFGDQLHVVGTVCVLRKPVLQGQFDYGEYLRHNGIEQIVYPISVETSRGGTGLQRAIYDFRDGILRRMLGPFTDDGAKALGAGILLGFGYNINHQTKEAFIRSGTIHLLTVSGTHVGLFAAFVALLLCFLPFRARAFSVLVLTFGYVFLTGLRAPSVRAYVMLLFLLGGRMLLLKTNAKNTLALAAVTLLLWNPYNLISAGFQFSFLTVWSILLLQPLLSRISEAFPVDQFWVASRNVDRWTFFWRSLWRKMLTAVLVSFVASLSCLAISVFYQGFLPGVAVAANLLLLPIVWWCFPLGVLSVILGPVFCIPLELLLQLIGFLCVKMGGIGVLHLATPPVWSVFSFLILTFLLLYFPRGCSIKDKWRRIPLSQMSREMSMQDGAKESKLQFFTEKNIFLMKIPIAVMMLCILLWWTFRPTHSAPSIGIFYGGVENGTVTVVILDPQDSNAYLLNLADFSQAKAVETFLTSHSISHCSDFVATDGKKTRIGGLQYFKIPIWCKHLYARQASALPDACAGNLDILRLFHLQNGQGGQAIETRDTRYVKILKSPGQCVLILRKMDLEVRCIELSNGETVVCVNKAGENVFLKTFPRSLYAASFIQTI